MSDTQVTEDGWTRDFWGSQTDTTELADAYVEGLLEDRPGAYKVEREYNEGWLQLTVRERSPKVEHYLTLVDGLFGLRAVGTLSQATEAEIAGTHAELWDTMTQAEQADVERLLESTIEKWRVR